MPTPGEYRTVQARILQYAQAIGWILAPRAEAERRRFIDANGKPASLYFDDLLSKKVKEFNPLYAEAPGALVGQSHCLQANIHGNCEFLAYLRNQGKFFHAVENRELDLTLVDYADLSQNIYDVTEEFYWNNGRFSNRKEVVFLINGIPVLVVECKNADKNVTTNKGNQAKCPSRQASSPAMTQE